jgi:ribulose kinase
MIRVWLRATVDAIGRPIEVAQDENLSLIGGGVSAAVALGLFANLHEASRACAVATRTFEPSAAAHARFRELLPTDRDASAIIAPISHKLARIPAGRAT